MLTRSTQHIKPQIVEKFVGGNFAGGICTVPVPTVTCRSLEYRYRRFEEFQSWKGKRESNNIVQVRPDRTSGLLVHGSFFERSTCQYVERSTFLYSMHDQNCFPRSIKERTRSSCLSSETRGTNNSVVLTKKKTPHGSSHVRHKMNNVKIKWCRHLSVLKSSLIYETCLRHFTHLLRGHRVEENPLHSSFTIAADAGRAAAHPRYVSCSAHMTFLGSKRWSEQETGHACGRQMKPACSTKSLVANLL